MSVAYGVEGAIKRWRNDESWFTDLDIALARLSEELAPTIFTTGVGKSWLVAQKLSASLRAHGVPAFDLDPVAALHGDLGGLRGPRGVVAISASGDTRELIELADEMKRLWPGHAHAFDVGLYGRRDVGSLTIAPYTSRVLPTFADADEDSYTKFVPSVSFIMACMMADELALAIARRRGAPGPAATHPSGSLGRDRPWEVQSQGGRANAEPTADSSPAGSAGQ